MRILIVSLVCILLPFHAGAQAPRVATSISPVYGIVSDVMRGAGVPSLILPKSEDPHHFSLRPSQLRQTTEAQVLFSVGADMEPWLERVAAVVSDSALIIRLAERPEVNQLVLSMRKGSRVDPHMWLDPAIVAIWAHIIAQELSLVDPENASLYRQNAEAIEAQAIAAAEILAESVGNIDGVTLVLAHDSFQYLERVIGQTSAGAMSDADGSNTGARSLSALTQINGPVCLINDAAHPNASLETLFPEAMHIQIDTLGTAFSGEPEFVRRYFEHIGQALAQC